MTLECEGKFGFNGILRKGAEVRSEKVEDRRKNNAEDQESSPILF